MRTTILAGALSLWLAGAALAAAGAEAGPDAQQAPTTAPATQPTAVPVNKTCPITGEAVDPKVTYVYEGKTVGFCCASCIADFKKDPAKYVKALK